MIGSVAQCKIDISNIAVYKRSVQLLSSRQLCEVIQIEAM